MFKKLGVLGAAACLPACLLADFSYEQSSKITGGMMAGMMKFAGAFSKQAREPIQTTVAVKGNRMVHLSKDRASVIDLDSETITDINFQKKQYSVMTFAEMTQAMEQALRQMQDKKNDLNADFKMDLKDTGESKQIAGFDAKKMVMTMQMDATDQKTGNKGGMLITTDLWIAPKVSGYDEIREFYKKMAAKLAWSPDVGNMMMGRADIARGMSNVYKEAAKLDGITVLMVMKMTPTADGQPASAPAGSDAQATSQQSKPKPETPSLSGALAGRLGGFGGFGRKKKQEQPKDDAAQSSSPAPAGDSSGTLMEMTTETSGFSSASVDASKFSVPAGFKKVDAEIQKRQRQ
jgi:hypothetical protein